MLTDQKHLAYKREDEISDISRDDDEVEMGTVIHFRPATGASDMFTSNGKFSPVRSVAGN